MAASDITLIGGDLRGIVTAIALSRRTVGAIDRAGWAFGYNVLLIPVAMGLLYPPFGHPAQPGHRRRRDGDEQRQRRHQRPAPARVPPPASAAAILHPGIGARLRDVGYLVAIGLVAVVIGGAAVVLANPVHTDATPGPSVQPMEEMQ